MIQCYSHLNGHEFLLVHKPHIWREIVDVIQCIDAASTFSKISAEKTKRGRLLYSPSALNKLFAREFEQRGWNEMRTSYYVNEDLQTTRDTVDIRDENLQRAAIESRGVTAYRTYNQVDFVKEHVAVEVQLSCVMDDLIRRCR